MCSDRKVRCTLTEICITSGGFQTRCRSGTAKQHPYSITPGAAYAPIFGPYADPPTPTSVIGKILYLAPGSQKWVEVANDLNYANGIAVSPDQKTLYVSQTVSNCILKFTIEADGSRM